MDIKTLSRGQPAPITADCINIEALAGGKARLSGSALCDGDSIALVGVVYDSAEEAEQQGLAWAGEQGVETLYVTYDAPAPGD